MEKEPKFKFDQEVYIIEDDYITNLYQIKKCKVREIYTLPLINSLPRYTLEDVNNVYERWESVVYSTLYEVKNEVYINLDNKIDEINKLREKIENLAL